MRIAPALAFLGLVAAGCADDPVSAPFADPAVPRAQSQEAILVDATGAVLERVSIPSSADAHGEIRVIEAEPAGSRATTMAMAPMDGKLRVNGDYCDLVSMCDRIASAVTPGGTPAGRWVRTLGETVQFDGTPVCQGVLEDEFGRYMYVVGQTGPTHAVLAYYYGDGLFFQASTPTFDKGCDDRVIEFVGSGIGRELVRSLAEGDRLMVVF